MPNRWDQWKSTPDETKQELYTFPKINFLWNVLLEGVDTAVWDSMTGQEREDWSDGDMIVLQTITFTKVGSTFDTWEDALVQLKSDYVGLSPNGNSLDEDHEILLKESLGTTYTLTATDTIDRITKWASVSDYLDYTAARNELFSSDIASLSSDWGWTVAEEVEPVDS